VSRVAIVDGPAQADALVSRLAGSPGDGIEIVAVGAEAEWRLIKAGQRFSAPDDFYDADDCRALKTEALSRAERLCAELDRAARPAWPSLPASFAPFAAQQFTVRHLLDHALFTAWRIDRIRRARPAATFVHFSAREEPLRDDLFFRDESAWSRASSLVLPARGAPCEVWPAPETPPTPLGPRLRGLLSGWKRSLVRARTPAAAPGSLVFLNAAYSTGLLAAEASRRGEKTAFLDPAVLEGKADPRVAAALARAWEELADSPGLRTLAEWDGIDLRPMLLPRLRHLFVSLGPRSETLFREASDRLSLGPKAAVAATMNWRDKLVSQACRAAGIPFTVYVHGTIGTRHSESVYSNDLAFADLYLVNGRSQEEYCRREFPQARGRTAAVGSAVLDRLSAELTAERRAEARRLLGASPGRPLVLYSLGGVRDFRFPQYHRTSHASFVLQRRVAELFARHPNVDLVIKHYGSNVESSPISSFVRELGAPNVRVIEQPPVSRLLAGPDAFMIDFPSTTLSEMALTDRPIVFLDALARLDWLPEARAAVRRRCEFIETLDQLESRLGPALAGGGLGSNADRSYVEDYGICRSDGQSLARAWAELERLVRGA
jgi:hypothetical protein